MISGAIINNVTAGGAKAQVADASIRRPSVATQYGRPAVADKATAKDEAELKVLTSNIKTKPTSRVVNKHIQAIMAAKGREIVKKQLPAEVGRAVEDAVQTSVKSGVISKAEGEGMRYALASEMLKRS
jgi:hypothetical protein